MTYTYHPKFPIFTINRGFTTTLSTNSWETRHVVTSDKRLDVKTLRHLHAAGLLGNGQTFEITSQCDGVEAPQFHQEVECVVVEDNRIVEAPAIREGGMPFPLFNCPIYVYHTLTKLVV